ncbi:MAG: DUF2723 domain-containing protein [candidate division Zixibacteria bacterium]|nr:DUF2723 domain-containing protein [candidate division Zixibacteria bacterium]
MLRPENLISASVFVFFTVIYGMTLCKTVFWWDSGELIANIAVLGIPHRPGFPIYVVLGKLFSFLPLWSFALRVNLLSCLFASFSLVIFYRIFQNSVSLFFPQMAKQKQAALISGFCFLLVFGFTYSFWVQAVRAEVYSLNMLFFSLLLLLVVQYLRDENLKNMYLFFFLLGLGLGNHHLSLLSGVPALVFLLSISHPRSLLNLRRVTSCALFSLLGLSIYFYLPIRSLSDPLLAWGKVKSLSSSAGSVFALDTIRRMNLDFVSDIPARIWQLLVLFSDQLTFICFVISLIGFFLLFRYNRRLLAFLLLLVAGNCAVVTLMTTEFIPTNPDLHGYLTFSIFALAFSFGMGVLLLLKHIRNSSSFVLRSSYVILAAISLFPIFEHYPEADLSKNRIAHEYGLSIISGLDSNSVLFLDNVNLNFISRELQYAEGIRKDVTVIDRGLLSFDWYAAQARKQREALFSAVRRDLKGELLFDALLKKSQDLGIPTYMEFTERDSDLVNYLVPKGYIFQVSQNPVEHLSEKDLLIQKRWDDAGSLDPQNEAFRRDWDAQRVFALSFYRLGLFYEWKGMTSCALDKFARVREVDPENEELILKMERLRALERLSGASHPDSSCVPSRPSG